jgi:hypothetical protein
MKKPNSCVRLWRYVARMVSRPKNKKKIVEITPPETNQGNDLKTLVWFFYIFISLSLILTGFGAGTGESHGWAAMTALLWALSSMAAGIAVGFLFGIPKILQGSPHNNDGNSALQVARETAYRQQVNTNLTEISDWLTKIIVGVGLIELKEIPPFIHGKAAVLAESLQLADPSEDYLGFAVAVIVGFTILGFLFGYIFTRVYLSSVFAKADLGANQLAEDARNGQFETLRDKVALVATEVKQLASDTDNQIIKIDQPVKSSVKQELAEEPVAEVMDEKPPQFSPEPTRTTHKSMPTNSWHERILEFAKKYNDVISSNKVERVRLRSDLANQMAALINKDLSYRDWAVKTALEKHNVGLIAGLATAINAEPVAGDQGRLFSVAHLVPFKHARNRIAAAIGSVFDAKIASQADIQPALAILSIYYNNNSDSSMQQRVRQTLAQISQSTGQSVGITGI